MMDDLLYNRDETSYKIRILSGIVMIQIVLILFIRFWPVSERVEPEQDDILFQDEIFVEDIQITRQESAPPPPPLPNRPEPVPVDEIVEEVIEFEDDLQIFDFPPLPPGDGQGQTDGEDLIVSNPQLPPTVVKIVEPYVPNLPQELRGKIELVVNFLVTETGDVEEASIVQIRQYDENFEEYEVLPHIQYGIIEATLDAAFQWEFRPARHEGSGVKTFTTHRFNY
ncbi:MAG: hypothetical protein WD355_12065 [Balneolaceae bacterium]